MSRAAAGEGLPGGELALFKKEKRASSSQSAASDVTFEGGSMGPAATLNGQGFPEASQKPLFTDEIFGCDSCEEPLPRESGFMTCRNGGPVQKHASGQGTRMRHAMVCLSTPPMHILHIHTPSGMPRLSTVQVGS